MSNTVHPRACIAMRLAIGLGFAVWSAAAAHSESVLRIAMTAGDIPAWTGQPDQGFEGYRFVGFNLYEGLVNWDLSRSDQEADLRPGLWEVRVSWTVGQEDYFIDQRLVIGPPAS